MTSPPWRSSWTGTKKQDTWKTDAVFTKDSFNLLQNILEEAGELDARVPYEDLVTTEFAEKAAG